VKKEGLVLKGAVPSGMISSGPYITESNQNEIYNGRMTRGIVHYCFINVNI